MERRGVIKTTQFAYRKGLGTLMHLCACPIHCKVHWIVGKRIGSYRLISAQVNHQGILYKLCSVGTVDSVLSILTQFLLNRSLHVMVDSCRSKLVNVVSVMPHGSVSCALLLLLCTSELFSILENKLTVYADDSILTAVVSSPIFRISVPESLSRHLVKVS